MKKIILLFLTLLLLSSCIKKNTYSNKPFRYKIQYPQGWVAINSGNEPTLENEFKIRLENESILSNYSSVDVAFFNPDSKPPIFESITVKAEQSRYNVTSLKEQISYITDMFTLELEKKFYNVENIDAKMQNFKKGKMFRFDFTFYHEDVKYSASYFIIPGQLYATYFINGICKEKDKKTFDSTLESVLNSFYKY